MWHFYWRSIRRIPSLAVEAVKRIDTFVGFLTICVWVFIGGTVAGAWWQQLPWQVPATAILVFSIYGFLSAVYQEYRQVEQERDVLKEGRETGAKRKAVKELLGAAMRGGEKLKAGDYVEDGERVLVSQECVEKWIDSTRDLIEAAFDKEEGRRFMNSEGYEPKKRPPWREVRIDPYRYHLTPRLQRLDQLILRASELPIDPDFDPDEWRER
jgi:hypothetical protein